jgi:undecaprenyl-diphosphatase
MLGWDRRLERWVVEHRVGFLDPIAEGLTYVGTYGMLWLCVALALALLRGRAAVLAYTLAADLTASLVANALKLSIMRARPELDLLVGRPVTSSFPSGHSASSFACATVLGALVPPLRLPAYVVAALVAWSRVYVGVHYPVDVLAGAVIGTLVGLLVLRALPLLGAARRRSRPETRPG